MNSLFPRPFVLSVKTRIVIFSLPFRVTPGATARLTVVATPGYMIHQSIFKKGGYENV